MKQELERLKALITQLTERLQSERDERSKLTNQLAVREGELRLAREQLADLRRKQEAIISQLRSGRDA